MKRLVLLGGGHAHLAVLRALAREPLSAGSAGSASAGPGPRSSAQDAAQVTLVTPLTEVIYSGMVPGVVAGHYRLPQAQIALGPLAKAAGVRLHQAAAEALDPQRREISLSDGTRIGYDLLSLDTGATQDRDIVPGARQHALFVRPVEALLERLQDLQSASGNEGLLWAVVGAGAAGFELALALAQAQREHPQSRGVLVTGAGPLLEGYTPAVQRAAGAALRRAGVSVLPGTCSEVGSGCLWLDGRTWVPCDLVVMAVGAKPHPWLQRSGLALDAQGFVATTATLQSRSHPEVFAAGDAASRPDAPHPRSGVHAVRAGPALAANLRAAVLGQPLKAYRPPRLTLNLLSCGARRSIAAYGPWSAEGAWVWWWKDLIDRRFVARMSR